MTRAFGGVIPTRVLTLFLSESVLIFGCYFAVAFLDPDIIDTRGFLLYEYGLVRIGIVAGLVVAGLYLRNLYAEVRTPGRVFLFQQLCIVFGIAFIGQGLISYLHRDLTIPRKMMIGGSGSALVCVFAWRILFNIVARDALDARRILFLGVSPTVAALARYFSEHQEFGLVPIGYLDHGGADVSAMGGMRRLGAISELSEVIEASQPNSIVIGKREDIRPEWTNEFLELRFGGVDAQQAATLYEKTFGRVCAAEIWPSKLIFGDTWRTRAIDLNLQTLYSIALATAAIPVALPAMALAALILKVACHRKALRKDRRVGLGGEVFTMYRLNSDPDTGFGRFLQKSGLERWPQLLNVLRGDMSIVGPRPDRPEFAQILGREIPFYPQRHQARPGMVGWAEAHRKSQGLREDALRRLEYDLYYVKKLSPMFDSFVLLLSLTSAIHG